MCLFQQKPLLQGEDISSPEPADRPGLAWQGPGCGSFSSRQAED